ncbi:MAG: hypothetical protein LLF94_07660 [Chlamydiales bacterium]|nr:hypothetical protein [Chlamydiales bacterium]
MKKALTLALLLVTHGLYSLQNEPWLGNWLEFEATLDQSRTQSSSVDTAHGAKHHKLHSNKTIGALEFMPMVNMSLELEFDLAETQKKSYGFDAFKAQSRYKLLNDLTGDPITLTAGLVMAMSTPTRVADLSSSQSGVFQTEARISFGRQFAIDDGSYWKAWGLVNSGLASSGSPWLGCEVHLQRVLHEKHHMGLFCRAAKGLSHTRLHHVSDFHSWSRIGYRYTEAGVSYSLKKIGYGSLYFEASKRLSARYCPKATWNVCLGVLIPFSPW